MLDCFLRMVSIYRYDVCVNRAQDCRPARVQVSPSDLTSKSNVLYRYYCSSTYLSTVPQLSLFEIQSITTLKRPVSKQVNLTEEFRITSTNGRSFRSLRDENGLLLAARRQYSGNVVLCNGLGTEFARKHSPFHRSEVLLLGEVT